MNGDLPPGPELDRRVAELAGCTIEPFDNYSNPCNPWPIDDLILSTPEVHEYWVVTKKFADGKVYHCASINGDRRTPWPTVAKGESRSHAACLAFVRAMEGR